MKELQGAVIIGSAFQTLIGYTGLMSLLARYDLWTFTSCLFVLLLASTSSFGQTAFIVLEWGSCLCSAEG